MESRNVTGHVPAPPIFWERAAGANVWDVDDNTLTRLLPFPIPVSHNIYPRWHPTRQALAYVSDYTVRAWANTSAGPGTPPDRINLRTSLLELQRPDR